MSSRRRGAIGRADRVLGTLQYSQSMRRSTHLAALAVAAALALAGCGDDTPRAERPPAADPTGSGYFVGTSGEGLGAAVDFMVDDPVTARVRARIDREADAAGTERPTVGLASLVNAADRPVPLPEFIAVLPNGGATPVPAARGPAGGPVEARFPAPPLFVPANGTATVYLLLRGVAPGAVDHLKMVPRPGEPVRLDARRR
jgi:hypothetical protein